MTGERFSVLYQQHKSELFLFANKLSSSHNKAEDLLQTTAVKAFINKDDVEQESKFKPWMATILYNTFVGEYRKRKRRRELMEEKGLHTDAFFNRKRSYNKGFERLKAEDIRSLAKEVSASSYEALELYMTGFAYDEISEILEVPVGTVKSRIHNARRKLKELCLQLELAA